jgi:hypothetical protein
VKLLLIIAASAATLSACAQPPQSYGPTTGSIAEIVSPDCTFRGTVPPRCGKTQAFRRFYSARGQSYMQAVWGSSGFPNNLPTPQPTSNPSPVPAVGYLYVEGFPTANLKESSTRAGFIFQPQPPQFSIFLRGPGGHASSRKRWSASGANLSVELFGQDPAQCKDTSAPCAVALFSGPCATPSSSSCSQRLEIRAPSWSSEGCCVVASVIAIVEPKPGGNFTSGYFFGPIDQVDCSAPSSSALGACTAPGQMYRGQSYPASAVVTTNRLFPGTETDTIDLAP